MPLFREVRQHPCRSYKSLITFAGYFSFGLFSGIFGPTLLDLRVKVQTDLKQLAFILPSKSFGSIIGTLIIGWIYTRSTWQLSSSLSLAILAASAALIPFMSSFLSLLSVTLVHGFMGGIFTCGSFIFINDLWGRESQPFQQILQFTFGAGSFTSPLVAQPYLLKTYNGTDSMSIYQAQDVKLQTPYLILAGTAILPVILNAITWYISPESPLHPSRLIDEDDDEEKSAQNKPCKDDYEQIEESIHEKKAQNNYHVHASTSSSSESMPLLLTPDDRDKIINRWQNVVIVLSFFFMHLYYGIEVAYGTYIASFVQLCALHLSESTGAFMSSAFWFTFTFFKLAAALYIDWIGSELNIAISIAIMVLANFVLLPFGEIYPIALWIGTVIVGIGTATVWASYFAYLEQFFTLSKAVTVTLMVASLLGDFILPIIIASFIQTYPRIFLWVYFGASVSMAIIFAIVTFICRYILKPYLPAH